MKNFLIISLLLAAIACKQDEKVQNTTLPGTESGLVTKTESKNVPEIKTAEPKAELIVDPIEYAADLGKAVFSKGDKILIGFDTQVQKGQIRINGKDYPLSKLTFTENNYEIKGYGITITASDGNFQEMVSDCAYGTFPEVKINLNGKETVLKNIKVQDCPNYN